MNTLNKVIVSMGWLSVLCAIPSMAQIIKSVKFNAPAAFYVGNAKMPAGSYTVTQPDMAANLLLIEDDNGSHSAYVEYEIVTSNTPQAQSDVTFNKYGKVDFLSAIWVQGQNSEMQIMPSKVEQKFSYPWITKSEYIMTSGYITSDRGHSSATYILML